MVLASCLDCEMIKPLLKRRCIQRLAEHIVLYIIQKKGAL